MSGRSSKLKVPAAETEILVEEKTHSSHKRKSMCCTTLLQHTALLYSPNVFSHLVFIVEPKKRLVKKAAWTNGEEYWILTVSTGSTGPELL